MPGSDFGAVQACVWQEVRLGAHRGLRRQAHDILQQPVDGYRAAEDGSA